MGGGDCVFPRELIAPLTFCDSLSSSIPTLLHTLQQINMDSCKQKFISGGLCLLSNATYITYLQIQPSLEVVVTKN